MITYDLNRARLAVQYLVNTSYFNHHLRKLRTTLAKPRALPFKDELEVLNELLVIGRQNREAMENLIKVAEFKRDDKNEYQRRFMAAKRQRDLKVIKLEELMQGKKLTLDERKDVLLKQYGVWHKERDKLVKKLGDASWADRNAAIRQFWEAKEAEVDALTTEARNAQEHHKKRKYTVVVSKPEPKSALGQKLKKALDKR
jgi:hypothetical protein